jgi:hypothetical protein
VAASRFDLTPLLRRWRAGNLEAYRAWVRRAAPIFLSVLEETTGRAVRRFVPAYSAVVSENATSTVVAESHA